MCSHKQRVCEHCGHSFECKPGNITNCQCYTVKLTEKEREFIASRYTNCLCAGCILQLKNEYYKMQQQLYLKTFFTGG